MVANDAYTYCICFDKSYLINASLTSNKDTKWAQPLF